jgi:hypothetical protein
MIINRIAIVIVTLSCFHFGCASNTGLEEGLSSSGPLISIDVDNKAKVEYLRNVRNSLKSYHQVILDLKHYHYRYNFKDFAKEIDKYVETYVNDVLVDSDSNSGIDIKLEIAKIHLLVTSMYFDIGYNIKAVKYLQSFHDRYHSDTYLLEKTLNPRDIGYSTLGQGMRILEERALREVLPGVHGKIYPWKRPHGRIYPWRNPNM